jgi:hypothetical protein
VIFDILPAGFLTYNPKILIKKYFDCWTKKSNKRIIYREHTKKRCHPVEEDTKILYGILERDEFLLLRRWLPLAQHLEKMSSPLL